MSGTGFDNGVAVVKNINFDYTSASPHIGILTSNGDLIIGSTANPNVAALKGQITSTNSRCTIGYSSPNITVTVDPNTVTGTGTDNHLVRWDGTGVPAIQDSRWILGDDGSFTLMGSSVNTLTMTALGKQVNLNTDSTASEFQKTTGTNNAALSTLRITAQTNTGTASGFGPRLVFTNETATPSTNNDSSYIQSTWTTATAGAGTSKLDFLTSVAGAIASTFTMTNNGNTSVNNFTMSAGQIVKRTATAISLTVTNVMYYIGVTDTSAARTITLPIGASVVTNQVFVIKDESGGAATNNITITCSGGATNIDGATSRVISSNYGSVNLIWNGTQYYTW